MLKNTLTILFLFLLIQHAKAQTETPGPLAGLTKTWQTRQVGDITYHYPDRINLKRAAPSQKRTRPSPKTRSHTGKN